MYVFVKNDFFLLEAHLPQEKTNICVELPTGKRISLEFKSSDTIKMVKNKIEVTEGIPAARQLFKLDGKELEDNRRLSYYGIQVKSTVELIECGMKIFVRTAMIGGEARTFFQEKFGILPDEQRLMYLPDNDLKDDLTLTHYNIKTHSRLYLFSRY